MSVVERGQLGGLTRRERPAFGVRPTLRFTVVIVLTIAWVAFGVWFSAPWRSDLEEAIGPVAAWFIPVLLAYIPGTLIGFLAFTLLLTRYRPPPLVPPDGPWPKGQWPPLTLMIAAWNEEESIAPTIERIADSTYEGPMEVVLADNNSTDARPRSPKRPPSGSGSATGVCSSQRRASTAGSTPRWRPSRHPWSSQ